MYLHSRSERDEVLFNDIKETVTAQSTPKTNVIHSIFSLHYTVHPPRTTFSPDPRPRTRVVDGKMPEKNALISLVVLHLHQVFSCGEDTKRSIA